MLKAIGLINDNDPSKIKRIPILWDSVDGGIYGYIMNEWVFIEFARSFEDAINFTIRAYDFEGWNLKLVNGV